MKRKILFVCNAIKWFDRLNGNTYHSVRVTRTRDNKTITAPYSYGYGDSYQTTALELMFNANWFKNYKRKGDNLPVGNNYTIHSLYMFERENNYPIMWNCSNGLKRDMIANSKM